jgi:hypothetical protein
LSSKSQGNRLYDDYDRCGFSGYEGKRCVGDVDDNNGDNCSGDNREEQRVS